MHGNSPICPSHCVAICNSAPNHSQALIAFDEMNEASEDSPELRNLDPKSVSKNYSGTVALRRKTVPISMVGFSGRSVVMTIAPVISLPYAASLGMIMIGNA